MRIAPFLTALSLALLPLAASAQAVPDAPAISPDAIRAHVEFLADDLLEGRETGTRGHEIAARYVATRFEALGMKPGGPGGSWYQQVRFAEYGIDPARPTSLTIGGKKFMQGEGVLLNASPNPATASETFGGGAVFVGHGVDSPENDDYAGLDVKGKFVIALTGMPEGSKLQLRTSDKVRIAKRHGAIGLLFMLSPDDLARTPWERYRRAYSHASTVWVDAEGQPEGEEGGKLLAGYLAPEAARVLFKGAPIEADALLQPGATVKSFALAPQLTVQRNSKSRIFTSPNVVGILPGSDPALASDYVVLSAHLDHLGISDEAIGDKINNGAMDNAGGVATMLEAARAFVTSGKPPRRSILFVALTAEEKGLLGSDYLAQHPVVSGRIVADVNLDMPILLYDFTDVVAFGAEHSTMGPIVARAAKSMGVTLADDPLPEENLFLRSDHYSFVKQGVPSVFLMTGFSNGGEKAFRDFLANTYHSPRDQPDLPIDWAAGAKFAKLNYLIAREIADGDTPPRWYEGNIYGDRFAPGQPRAPQPAK